MPKIPAKWRFNFFLSAAALLFIASVLVSRVAVVTVEQQALRGSIETLQDEVAFYEADNGGPVTQPQIIERTNLSRKIVNLAENATSSQASSFVETLGAKVVEEGNGYLVVILPDDEIGKLEEELGESDLVSGVETDYVVRLMALPDWGVKRIRADQVWGESRGGGVKVAIIDTGVDHSHFELSANYAGGYDFVNGDADPFDDHGHGTAVAGIAAAAINGSGTIGVGPEISILAVKVLAADGYGYLSDVVAGIDWAVENGASVINMSLGTTHNSSLLKTTVDKAASRGVVLVAAAGNTSGGSLTYPAAYDAVIAVGATDANDKLASFSALGSELVAPGVSIKSPWPGGGYKTISGTSASSPHVAGLAAHLIANGTSGVRKVLQEAVVDLGAQGYDVYFGYGLPDAVAALGLAEEDSEAPVVAFVNPNNNDQLSGHVVVEVSASDDRGVVKVDLIVNGNHVYSSAEAPYRWYWDLSQAASGRYRLNAKAYDEAGNMGEASIQVRVVGEDGPGGGADKTNNRGGNQPTNQQAQPESFETFEENLPVENLPSPVIEKLQNVGTGQTDTTNGQGASGQGGKHDNPGRVRGIGTYISPWNIILMILGIK
jgi:hypothetical protein